MYHLLSYKVIRSTYSSLFWNKHTLADTCVSASFFASITDKSGILEVSSGVPEPREEYHSNHPRHECFLRNHKKGWYLSPQYEFLCLLENQIWSTRNYKTGNIARSSYTRFVFFKNQSGFKKLETAPHGASNHLWKFALRPQFLAVCRRLYFEKEKTN